MKIERVDDKTVKCFLSNEELEEYDIDYKDFVMRSQRAREVVQEIIELAEEEVGYKPPKFSFDLQIMMLPDQGLMLTLSERESTDLHSGEQLLEYLRDMKQLLLKTREQLGIMGNSPEGDTAVTDSAAQEEQESAVELQPAVFEFDRLADVMTYAGVLPGNLRVDSALYRMGESYYLYLQKGSASYERFSKACIQALEYASLYSAEEERLWHLKEHGECLIAEQALKKLRGKPGKNPGTER